MLFLFILHVLLYVCHSKKIIVTGLESSGTRFVSREISLALGYKKWNGESPYCIRVKNDIVHHISLPHGGMCRKYPKVHHDVPCPQSKSHIRGRFILNITAELKEYPDLKIVLLKRLASDQKKSQKRDHSGGVDCAKQNELALDIIHNAMKRMPSRIIQIQYEELYRPEEWTKLSEFLGIPKMNGYKDFKISKHSTYQADNSGKELQLYKSSTFPKCWIHVHGFHHTGTGVLREKIIQWYRATQLDKKIQNFEEKSIVIGPGNEDEGQKLQNIYPDLSSRRDCSSNTTCRYDYAPLLNLVSKDNKEKLKHQWMNHVKDLNNPIIVQKTPSFDVIFLEKMFENSAHALIMRHPYYWSCGGFPCCKNPWDCFQTWKRIWKKTFKTLTNINKYVIIQYEALPDTIDWQPCPSKGRRLEFHGQTIDTKKYLDPFASKYDKKWIMSDDQRKNLNKWESFVRRNFGYSLLNRAQAFSAVSGPFIATQEYPINIKWPEDKPLDNAKKKLTGETPTVKSVLLQNGVSGNIFYDNWLKQMMPRIHAAGKIVTRGFHETRLKGDASLVTDADMDSSQILTNGWTLTPIISEETWNARWAAEKKIPNTVTWVDPLDATKEYTEGLTQYVSIMACLTENGRPKAGIIHFPFRNETWAVANNKLLNKNIPERPPETVIVSRSHAGAVSSYINGYSIIPAGGSGYKSVEVLKGHVKAYLHTTNIKTWDICAADALIHAANGTFIEWTTGERFNYVSNLQTGGIFASTSMSRIQFRIAVAIRSKFFQMALVIIAWILIYMYPQNKLSVHIKTTDTPIRFIWCALALLSFYITWGIAQERIMSFEYGGERFKSPTVLVFISRLLAALFSYFKVRSSTTPFRLFSVASLTNVVSSVSQYTALMTTIFPVVVVFKSLKLIPVLFVGHFFFHKKYKPIAYLLALGLAGGVSLTLVSTIRQSASEQSILGIIFMTSYVVFDALTSQLQSYVFNTYDTPPLEMMWGVNTCSVIFTGIIIATSGQGIVAFEFATRHPEFLIHVCMLCFPAVIGQWFIFKTIEQHGAAAFAMVMTSRQAFSLLVSCLLFGHQLDILSIMGIFIVMVVLCIKTRVKLTKEKHIYKKIPHKDLEKGDLKD